MSHTMEFKKPKLSLNESCGDSSKDHDSEDKKAVLKMNQDTLGSSTPELETGCSCNTDDQTQSSHDCCQDDKTKLKPSCQFYLERKRRNCKVDAAPGKLYCVEHSIHFQTVSRNKTWGSQLKTIWPLI